MAYLTTTVPASQRGRAISSFGGINRIGTFVGPGIGGVVGQHFTLASPFLITAACAAAAGGISFLYVTESARKETAHAGMRWKVVGTIIRQNYKELGTAGSAQIFAQMIKGGPADHRALVRDERDLFGRRRGWRGLQCVGGYRHAAVLPGGLRHGSDGPEVRLGGSSSSLSMAVGMGIIPFTHSFTSLAVATIVVGLGNGLGADP